MDSQSINPLKLHTKLCVHKGLAIFSQKKVQRFFRFSEWSVVPFKIYLGGCTEKGPYYSEQLNYQRDDASGMARSWAWLPQTCVPWHTGSIPSQLQNPNPIWGLNTLQKIFWDNPEVNCSRFHGCSWGRVRPNPLWDVQKNSVLENLSVLGLALKGQRICNLYNYFQKGSLRDGEEKLKPDQEGVWRRMLYVENQQSCFFVRWVK